MTEYEYSEPPWMRKLRKEHPSEVKPATAASLRKHYQAKGYEVQIGDDDSVTIRKPGRPWRDVGFVDEYMDLTGKAAEANFLRKLTNTIKSRRYARRKRGEI